VSGQVTVDGSVVIIDNQDAFCLNLGRSFRQLGLPTWLTEDPAEARALIAESPPALIVTELRVAGQWAFDFIEEFRGMHPTCPVVICTVYPSVATAVRAVRMGFDGYVAKPVAARTILELVKVEAEPEPEEPDEPEANWPSLDRTIWEYINQVYVTAGTMSEAARRLGLDRRSLRRMLAKYPPSR
jgi:two-component system response regulator RegA